MTSTLTQRSFILVIHWRVSFQPIPSLWLLLGCVGKREQEIENEGYDEIPGCVLHLASSAQPNAA